MWPPQPFSRAHCPNTSGTSRGPGLAGKLGTLEAPWPPCQVDMQSPLRHHSYRKGRLARLRAMCGGAAAWVWRESWVPALALHTAPSGPGLAPRPPFPPALCPPPPPTQEEKTSSLLSAPRSPMNCPVRSGLPAPPRHGPSTQECALAPEHPAKRESDPSLRTNPGGSSTGEEITPALLESELCKGSSTHQSGETGEGWEQQGG